MGAATVMAMGIIRAIIVVTVIPIAIATVSGGTVIESGCGVATAIRMGMATTSRY